MSQSKNTNTNTNPNEQAILDFLKKHYPTPISGWDIARELDTISKATTYRILKTLTQSNRVTAIEGDKANKTLYVLQLAQDSESSTNTKPLIAPPPSKLPIWDNPVIENGWIYYIDHTHQLRTITEEEYEEGIKALGMARTYTEPSPY